MKISWYTRCRKPGLSEEALEIWRTICCHAGGYGFASQGGVAKLEVVGCNTTSLAYSYSAVGDHVLVSPISSALVWGVKWTCSKSCMHKCAACLTGTSSSSVTTWRVFQIFLCFRWFSLSTCHGVCNHDVEPGCSPGKYCWSLCQLWLYVTLQKVGGNARHPMNRTIETVMRRYLLGNLEGTVTIIFSPLKLRFLLSWVHWQGNTCLGWLFHCVHT